jgi:LmbE family N-acetylglucosaminyl deacetylase
MKVTVISPHPDDETLGCGGTLLKHKAAGDQLDWIIVTQAHEPQWSSNEITQKSEEIDRVSEFYGFKEVQRLGFPTMALDTKPLSEIISSLGNALSRTGPECLYLTHGRDIHSDHRVVFDATMSAVKSFNSQKHGIGRILSYEVLSSTDAAPATGAGFAPNVFNDISPFLEQKLKGMSLYETEVQPFPLPRAIESIRALARFRGATIGVEYAEAFMLVREVM